MYDNIPQAQSAFDQTSQAHEIHDFSKDLENIGNTIKDAAGKGFFNVPFGPFNNPSYAEGLAIYLEQKGYHVTCYAMGVQQFGLNVNWKYIPTNTRERLV